MTSTRMVRLATEIRITNIETVDGSSSKTQNEDGLAMTPKPRLSACCSKRFHWSALLEACKAVKAGSPQYVNAYYATVPQQVQVQPKARRRLTVQIDELWSFVDDKGNEQWVWLALNVETREIVGCYIGERSGESAKALWQSLPAVYLVILEEAGQSYQRHLELYP